MNTGLWLLDFILKGGWGTPGLVWPCSLDQRLFEQRPASNLLPKLVVDFDQWLISDPHTSTPIYCCRIHQRQRFVILLKKLWKKITLTTKLLQRFLRVRLSIAALPNVAGLQLHRGPNGGQRLTTRLQVHLGKQLLTACSWLVVDSLIQTWGEGEWILTLCTSLIESTCWMGCHRTSSFFGPHFLTF